MVGASDRVRLLDANVLLALAWPQHAHHALAVDWFRRSAARHWATCALTQLAFIRISANPRITVAGTTPRMAAALLRVAGVDVYFTTMGGGTNYYWYFPDINKVESADKVQLRDAFTPNKTHNSGWMLETRFVGSTLVLLETFFGHLRRELAEPLMAQDEAPLDLSGLQHLIGFLLAMGTVSTRRAFQQHIGTPFGLRPVEFTLLLLLKSNGMLAPKQLARALSLPPPNVTVLLDRLVGREFVERRRSPHEQLLARSLQPLEA